MKKTGDWKLKVMIKEHILELIGSGENLNIEFKESRSRLNKDVFDSVCAFLNRNGGHLLLGVKDDGTIVGVDKESVDRIKRDTYAICKQTFK